MSNGNIMKSSKEHDLNAIAIKNAKRLQKHKSHNDVPHSGKLTMNSLMRMLSERRRDFKVTVKIQTWLLQELSGSYEMVKFKSNRKWQMKESVCEQKHKKVLSGKITLYAHRKVNMGKNKNVVAMIKATRRANEFKLFGGSLNEIPLVQEEVIEKKNKSTRIRTHNSKLELQEKQIRGPNFRENQLRYCQKNQTEQLALRNTLTEANTCFNCGTHCELESEKRPQNCFKIQQSTKQTNTPKTELENQNELSNRLPAEQWNKEQNTTQLQLILKLKSQILTPPQYTFQTQNCQEDTNKVLERAELIELPGNVQRKMQVFSNNSISGSQQTKQQRQKTKFQNQEQRRECTKLKVRRHNYSEVQTQHQNPTQTRLNLELESGVQTAHWYSFQAHKSREHMSTLLSRDDLNAFLDKVQRKNQTILNRNLGASQQIKQQQLKNESKSQQQDGKCAELQGQISKSTENQTLANRNFFKIKAEHHSATQTQLDFKHNSITQTSRQYPIQPQKYKEYRNTALAQTHLIELPDNVQLKTINFLNNNLVAAQQTKQQQLKNISKSQQQLPNWTELEIRTRTRNKKQTSEQNHCSEKKQSLTNAQHNWRSTLFRGMRPQKSQQINERISPHCIFQNFNFSHYQFLLLLSTLLCLLSALPQATHAACRNATARPCEAICTSDGLNCTLRALLLLPDDDTYLASMRSSMPALHLAEQYVRNNSLLPSQLHFEWMTDDVKCDASYATIKAMDGISKDCAHVVFGPVCDYALAAVSRIAKYFNSNGTPVITVGGATDSFEDQKTTCADEFYMLVRSGLLSFKSLSVMTIEVLKRYNWSNPIAVYEPNSREDVVGEHSCFLMMKSFSAEMRNLNLTFAQYSLAPELRNRTEELKREIGNKHTSESSEWTAYFAAVDGCFKSDNEMVRMDSMISGFLQDLGYRENLADIRQT